MTTENNNSNRPDFRVSYQVEAKDGKKTIYCGAAWRHKTGDGINIQLDSGARFTLFPSKQEAEDGK